MNSADTVNAGSSLDNQQLVLDVPKGTQVVLRRKEQGARSQLWRMTGEGQLQHEGSSPPQDPRLRSSEQSNNILVSPVDFLCFVAASEPHINESSVNVYGLGLFVGVRYRWAGSAAYRIRWIVPSSHRLPEEIHSNLAVHGGRPSVLRAQ